MWTTQRPALHFRTDGAGPHNLLLLHEIGGSLRSWDRVVELADPRFRFIRFDQRGFGHSEKPRAQYGFDELQGDVASVLDAAGVSGSFGICAAAGACAIAAGLAAAMPDRVTELILCSPALAMNESARIMTRERAAQVIGGGMGSIADQAMDRMFPPVVRNAAFEDYRHHFLANDPVGFALANLALAGMAPDLERIECPVMILAGRHDIRSPEQVAQSAERIRDVTFRIIEHGGHVLPVQAPDAIGAVLADLVSASEPQVSHDLPAL